MEMASGFWRCPHCGGWHTRIKKVNYDYDRYCDDCRKGFSDDVTIKYCGLEIGGIRNDSVCCKSTYNNGRSYK